MTAARHGTPEPAPDPTLEEALGRLEAITARLDGSELELADALALYEEGVHLLRVADRLLGQADARVRQLRPDGDSFRLDDLDTSS